MTYTKGQVILPLHRRSLFQPHYKDFYEGRCNKMLDDVEKVLSQPNKYGNQGHAPTTIYEGLISTVKAPREMFKDSPQGKSPTRNQEAAAFSTNNVMSNEGGGTGRSQKQNDVAMSGSPRRNLRNGQQPEVAEKQFEDPPQAPITIILEGKCKVVNPQD